MICIVRAGLLVYVLLAASGCQAFRAEVGLGLGFGAEVKLPYVLHTGFGMQKHKYMGLNYDEGFRVGREDEGWEFSGSLVIFHHEEVHDRFITLDKTVSGVGYEERHYAYGSKNTHMCLGVAPYLFDKHDHAQSTPLEIRVHALFLSLRLGFDPTKLVGEAEEKPEDSKHPDYRSGL